MSSFEQIQGCASICASDNILVYLVGTKTDLADLREVSYELAANKAKELNAIYLEISTKTKKNLNQLLKMVSLSLLAKF